MNKYQTIRILTILIGYLFLFMGGAFANASTDIVLYGVLKEPWLEWTLTAIVIFSLDMFVTPRFKQYLA